MSDTADAIAPAFTLLQLEALLAWSARRPRGFRVAITTENDCAEEIAEISQRADYAYAMHHMVSGRIHLEMESGADAWEADTVEEALEALLANEEALEAGWIAAAAR